MEPLWTQIDNWLVVNLAGRMGKASNYTTLKLASYHDEILTMPQQWAGLTLPAAFIESTSVETVGGQVLGEPNEMLSYSYGISVVTLCDSKAQAKNNAKVMVDRLRQFLYYAYIELPRLAESGGEKIEDLRIGTGFYKPIQATGDKWYGFALYSFDVLTLSRSI